MKITPKYNNYALLCYNNTLKVSIVLHSVLHSYYILDYQNV